MENEMKFGRKIATAIVHYLKFQGPVTILFWIISSTVFLGLIICKTFKVFLTAMFILKIIYTIYGLLCVTFFIRQHQIEVKRMSYDYDLPRIVEDKEYYLSDRVVMYCLNVMISVVIFFIVVAACFF